MLVGIGALAVAAVISAPTIFRAARPMLKEGLRRSMRLYDQARGAAAEVAEDVEDLVAEVRADIGRATAKVAPVHAEEDDKAA